MALLVGRGQSGGPQNFPVTPSNALRGGVELKIAGWKPDDAQAPRLPGNMQHRLPEKEAARGD